MAFGHNSCATAESYHIGLVASILARAASLVITIAALAHLLTARAGCSAHGPHACAPVLRAASQ